MGLSACSGFWNSRCLKNARIRAAEFQNLPGGLPDHVWTHLGPSQTISTPMSSDNSASPNKAERPFCGEQVLEVLGVLASAASGIRS